MEESEDTLDADWNQVWMLNNEVQQGRALQLTDEVRALLRRTAPTVAISDAETEAAIINVEHAAALIQKIEARIRDGSSRIGNALHQMYRLQEKSDLEGARQLMRDVLAVEVVPLYREIAEGELEKMDDADD
jgi:DUSAM domain-containing protein